MVAFDATVLIDLFNPKLQGDRRLKLDELMAELERTRTKIAIPAPAYAEFLTRADKAREGYINEIAAKSAFRIEAFAEKAALECAIMLDRAFTSKERRQVSKTKFKFDWQIVAVAKAVGATIIYTNDDDVVRYARQAGIQGRTIDDLPVPDAAKQKDWVRESASEPKKQAE